MKLCAHVLLLALGAISGHKCHGSIECDISSQLHLATKTTKATKVTKATKAAKVAKVATPKISEFQTIDPFEVEVKGPPNGELTTACLWMVSTDSDSPPSYLVVDDPVDLSGIVLNPDGLEFGVGPDLGGHPTFAIFLTEGCPTAGQHLQTDIANILLEIGGISDSIFVPDNAARVPDLQTIFQDIKDNAPAGFLVHGTVFGPFGSGKPELVFRDRSAGLLYQVPSLGGTWVLDADGNPVNPADFDPPTPSDPTFGDINPTVAPRISEFQTIAPFDIELSGPPNGILLECIWTVSTDSDSPSFLVVEPPVDLSGIVLNPDGLELSPGPLSVHPTFAIFLTHGCPTAGRHLQTDLAAILAEIWGISDSIFVPDDADRVPDLQTIFQGIKNNVPPWFLVHGTVLGYHGDDGFPGKPQLVFRDRSVGAFYQVPALGAGLVFDANGMAVNAADFDPPTPSFPTFADINPTLVASMTGDPHIHTMDGGHYTLLREGTFLLWHFGLPQPHVEWQIFAHYAGRQSFAKGFLLVDTSGSEASSMEITSEHCEWQTQSNSKKWSSVNSEVPQVLLSGPASRMELVGSQRKDMKKIQLFMSDEKVPVATLKVMCRQGRHINMKLHMANQKWGAFVSGELKGQKDQKHKPSSKTSMLQLATREDQEFEVKKTWAELGGSSHAQSYLQTFDQDQHVVLSQMCDPQAQADARTLCQKHLGTVVHSSYFEECVYDVCSGGGEVAAEMVAEMLKF
eukprot:s630_g12.t1